MARTIPSQKVVMLQNPDMLKTIQIHDNDLDVFNEEQALVDCPDCYDTMIRIYDSDKIRYRCENCDLIIGARSL